eukprot:gb/GFBE01073821.1/.p1 GENE.gb/GFBE01073821.1/~~gb/GFBE01073821.1/.p1  ORF type:complete len:409 (+),score=31.86 gb/GFBE01073821.1/:1-1227(+)
MMSRQVRRPASDGSWVREGSNQSNQSNKSNPFKSGKQAKQAYLEEGNTTIMLRSLPTRMTTEMLCTKLDEVAPGRFDFVYVPQDSRKEDRNIALAFINFVDHESAKHAFKIFSDEALRSGSLWSTPRVSQAHVQGLAPNIAYFLAKAGLKEVNNACAPHMFQDGVRVEDNMIMVNKYVSIEMLSQARQMAAEFHRTWDQFDDSKSNMSNMSNNSRASRDRQTRSSRYAGSDVASSHHSNFSAHSGSVGSWSASRSGTSDHRSKRREDRGVPSTSGGRFQTHARPNQVLHGQQRPVAAGRVTEAVQSQLRPEPQISSQQDFAAYRLFSEADHVSVDRGTGTGYDMQRAVHVPNANFSSYAHLGDQYSSVADGTARLDIQRMPQQTQFPAYGHFATHDELLVDDGTVFDV